MAMDFFSHQDRARKNSKYLILYFILGIICIIGVLYLCTVFLFHRYMPGLLMPPETWFAADILFWVSLITAGIILGGSFFKSRQLAVGGQIVAFQLGARKISSNSPDPKEKVLINVVEEMSIASGTPMPGVYVIEEEGINAFAAGYNMDDAVVAVTRGALEQLNRDELQGVIAHEFSHIHNGDMRINIRLMGLIFGLLLISQGGYLLLRGRMYSGSSRSRNKNALPLMLFALVLIVVGFIGVFFGRIIQSAVSRQREYLADASAVQFTRNPRGIAGALKKIGRVTTGSKMKNPKAAQISHMLFANGLKARMIAWFQTHPPLEKRIQRIQPGYRAGLSDKAHSITPSAPLSQTQNMSAAGIVAMAGRPEEEHIQYAGSLLKSIPEEILNHFHNPEYVDAAVLLLLMGNTKEIIQRQENYLNETGQQSLASKWLSLAGFKNSIPPEARLPLLEISVPVIRELEYSRYNELKQTINFFIRADYKINAFEFLLVVILVKHCDPAFGRTNKQPLRYSKMDQVLPQCVGVLSFLAWNGAQNQPDLAEKAFKTGILELGIKDYGIKMLDQKQAHFERFESALTLLGSAYPGVKKGFLKACYTCVMADNKAKAEEVELYRAISIALDCPMPPII